MSKSSTKRVETKARENPDVVVVKAATAPKLSPRGEGGIDYQVGRVGADVYVRIERNHGGGSCSKEWVPVDRIRLAITPAMAQGEPFKSDALVPAYVGRSQCNSGFLVAALRAEGLFRPDGEHKGMSRLAGDLEAWEIGMREAAPILGDDGQPVTVRLHPELKETKFRPKQAVPDPADGQAADAESMPVDGVAGETTPSASENVEGERKPILRKVRRIKRQDGEGPDCPDPSAAVPEPEATATSVA